MPTYASSSDSDSSFDSSSDDDDSEHDGFENFLEQYKTISEVENPAKKDPVKPMKKRFSNHHEVVDMMDMLKTTIQTMVENEVPKVSQMQIEDREKKVESLLKFALDQMPCPF